MKNPIPELVARLRRMSDSGQRLPNLVEVAEGLGIPGSTARKRAELGDIPAIKIGGRWKSHREILQAWRDGEGQPTPSKPKRYSHRKNRAAQIEQANQELKSMGV